MTPAPLSVKDLSGGCSDGIPAASGRIDVRLDNGRTVMSHHSDLLAAVADLAGRRAILDSERTLLLDPLVPPPHGETIVLQVRIRGSGAEVGVRTLAAEAFDDALRNAWQHLHRFADRSEDAALLSELSIPHTVHYDVRLP